MSGRCVVEAISGGKISPVSKSKRKPQSFPHLRRSLDTRGLRVWREEGRLIAFVPSGTSLMKGAVAAQVSFLTLDQKPNKYFCKHPKIKLCRQRYLPCKSETLQAFNTCRRVQVCPQREHALSISEFPHRRKLSGVGVVFVIAWREKRSSPSLFPNISRRQVRSECITSVHSKNFPWISSFLSLDNCSSVSTSETRFSILFRENAWLLLQTDLDCNWLEAGRFASTTVAAQAFSTAGGNFFVRVLCRWTCASYSFLHRRSEEFLRRSMQTICICFQGNKICDMQTCLSRLPQKQNWGVRRTWKTRPVLQKLCWNGLQYLREGGGEIKCGEVPTHLRNDKVLVQPKFTCFRQMLRINQEEPLFQLGRDFRTSKFFAASYIGGSSKIAKISIVQVLEGLFWDLEVWIESAEARQSIFTLLGFESLQSHWPTFVWASFHRFCPF